MVCKNNFHTPASRSGSLLAKLSNSLVIGEGSTSNPPAMAQATPLSACGMTVPQGVGASPVAVRRRVASGSLAPHALGRVDLDGAAAPRSGPVGDEHAGRARQRPRKARCGGGRYASDASRMLMLSGAAAGASRARPRSCPRGRSADDGAAVGRLRCSFFCTNIIRVVSAEWRAWLVRGGGSTTAARVVGAPADPRGRADVPALSGDNQCDKSRLRI
jgi:hypothetical protein